MTGITRAINGTKETFPYSSGNLVYKYEMNNVSLLRINKTHTLSDANIANQIGLDHYNLKIDVSSGDDTTDRTGASFPKLFFRESDFFGGGDVEATYNVPFEIITPKLEVINPKLTTLSAAAERYLDKVLMEQKHHMSIRDSKQFLSTIIISSHHQELLHLK